MFNRYAPLLYVALFLSSLPLFSQQTFTVTVANKTSQHPYFHTGWGEGFVIDGVEGKELTLTRGKTYTFQLNNVSSAHTFYITTNPAGGGSDMFSSGVTGNFATGNGVLTFTPDASAPALLYYQCGVHSNMGWKINITNASSAPEYDRLGSAMVSPAAPNPFSVSSSFSVSVPRDQQIQVELFDQLGNRVSTLYEGAMRAGEARKFTVFNSNLPAGIYTYRVNGATFSDGGKIILVR